ncbi:hypothetical protein [Trinickia fusca]|uniref:Uncharacterized protein n=1 Tax=Trinickia fusca TaxID=2419777 RepID=A0A494XEF3_9BURK|nr:hypothetical protein [Trinickia fusca]RKP48262.1 hypothetical protein D7S89_13125 [Trinickia fusca]
MIHLPLSLAGVVYTALKDIKAKYFDWKEEDKIVDVEWLERKDIKAELLAQGFELKRCSRNRLDVRVEEGWEEVCEPDEKNKVIKRLVFRDGGVLIRRKL